MAMHGGFYIHPLIAAGTHGESPLLAISKVLDTPGADEAGGVCIPMTIAWQKRLVAGLHGLVFPSDAGPDVLVRAKFFDDLSSFHRDVLQFVAVKAIEHGDIAAGDIGDILAWATLQRQNNEDIAVIREAFLRVIGKATIVEALKSAFSDGGYGAYAIDTIKTLFKEPQLETAIMSFGCPPITDDADTDRGTFETVLSRLHVTLVEGAPLLRTEHLHLKVGRSEADWKATFKSKLYSTLRHALLACYHQQPERLLADQPKESGGVGVLMGEDLDSQAIMGIVTDAHIAAAIALARQCCALMDAQGPADEIKALQQQMWGELAHDQLKSIHSRRFLMEVHKRQAKAGAAFASTSSSTTTSSDLFDLSKYDHAEAMMAALGAVSKDAESDNKKKLTAFILPFTKCCGAILHSKDGALVLAVGQPRAIPLIGQSLLKLRQTCLALQEDFIASRLNVFSNVKETADVNMNKSRSLPTIANYKMLMSCAAKCLQSSLYYLVSDPDEPESFADTMQGFLQKHDFGDDFAAYNCVVARLLFYELQAFHGTENSEHGVIVPLFRLWYQQYQNVLSGLSVTEFVPLQRYFMEKHMPVLALDVYNDLLSARTKSRAVGLAWGFNADSSWDSSGHYDDDAAADDGSC